MVRKPAVDDNKEKTLADIIRRQLYNQGIGELHTKGLSEEEESSHIKKTFEEISALGYGHIHTLKIVPSDSKREPYFVHRDNIDRL
jgi:hypothetical protein